MQTNRTKKQINTKEKNIKSLKIKKSCNKIE